MTALKDRILAHTRRDGNHLLWDGYMLKGRYPVYCYRGEAGRSLTVRVSRFLYIDKNGPLSGNLYPTCTKERCVEPSHHLHRDTTREKRSRTRRDKAIRSQRVELVRKLSAEGYSRIEIANALDLKYSLVCRVIKQAS